MRTNNNLLWKLFLWNCYENIVWIVLFKKEKKNSTNLKEIGTQ